MSNTAMFVSFMSGMFAGGGAILLGIWVANILIKKKGW